MGVYQQGIEYVVSKRLKESPELAIILADVLDKMNTGFYPRRHVDVIVQKHRFGYDMYDAYCYAQAHTLIGIGEWVITEIDIGCVPHSDKAEEINNEYLRNLNPVFSAECWSGTQDEDGYLEWDQPIQAEQMIRRENGNIDRYYCTINPRNVPLEIGSQSGAKTLVQVKSSRGLARWPYGSTVITILHVAQMAKSITPANDYEPTLFDYAAGLRTTLPR